MKWRTSLTAAALATCALSAQVPGLTRTEIESAIAAAKLERFQSLFVEARGRFGADFSLLLQGPVGRVMDLAREAYESYKPFNASDVPMIVSARETSIAVVVHSGSRIGVKNLVIMPPGAASRDAAIQPLPVRRDSLDSIMLRGNLPRTWRPGLGSEPSGLPSSYRFPEDAIPSGDILIVVVTDSGEQRYTVRDQDRRRLR